MYLYTALSHMFKMEFCEMAYSALLLIKDQAYALE